MSVPKLCDLHLDEGALSYLENFLTLHALLRRRVATLSL